MPDRDEPQFQELLQEPRRVRWIWLVYAALYAVAVPWYWPVGYRGVLVWGFPLWVATSLAAILLLAGWTALVTLRYWRVDERGPRDGD